MDHDPLLQARAWVLNDLSATGTATPDIVSLLEDAVEQRRWWVDQWPEGRVYAAGLVAQDVQDALLELAGRWPLCPSCAEPEITHALYVHPEIGGPEPSWVCEESGRVVAPLGSLPKMPRPV